MSEPTWRSPSDQSTPPAAPTGPPIPDPAAGPPPIAPPGSADAVPPYAGAADAAPDGAQPAAGMPDIRPPVPGEPVGAGPDPATPVYYAIPDPSQNWGLTPNAGVRYEVVVPRPPRPATVTVALVLTYVGIGLAMVYLVVNSISQWQNRDQIVAEATRNARSSNVDMTSLARDTVGIALGVTIGIWLLAAAGLAVCAVLANRGYNGARITLMVLMGVFGAFQLCGGVSAGVVMEMNPGVNGQTPNSPFTSLSTTAAEIHWWSYVGPGLLAAVGLIVFVLLIVPPTNRYFSAGAGRRFAPRR